MAGKAIGPRRGGRGGPPGGIAEQGRLFWSSRGTSRGKKATIPWGVPGDFVACVRHMRGKVKDPKGYCALRHHEATGEWPGPNAHGGKTRHGSRIRR